MADITEKSGLVRELGLTQAAAIGLGTMLGAGIFVLSSIAAEGAGPAATFSYIIAGLIVLPTAFTVSELATGMPEAGGSYHLISRALGPLAGAIVGPGNWLGLTFATAFYLIGFAEYMAYFLPIPIAVTAVAGGLLFAFLNYRGSKISGQVQNVIVIILLLILGYFAVRAFFSVDPELHEPFVPYGWGAVAAQVGLVIVSFTGFEKISTIAAEVKNPGRNLPLAIVGSVIIATVLYAAILYAVTGVISYVEIGTFQAPLVEAAERFMSSIGVFAMSVAALLATASSANAAIMASSRINYAMGRDSILPGWFSEIHPDYHTPYHSILVTGALAVLLALSGQAELLAEISSALFMISYALLALSLLVVRRAEPAWYRPSFRSPLFPALPILGGLLALAVIVVMEPVSQIASLVLVAVSLLWYFLWARPRTGVEGELLGWWGRERPLEAALADVHERSEEARREVLVPVANPQTAGGLVSLAAALARGQGDLEARVVALKVVPVPLNLPLEGARHYLRQHSGEHRESLQKAMEAATDVGVPVDTVLRAAHGVASGIVAVARQRPDTRLILLGWHGPLTLSRVRTSIDQDVLQSAPVDVAVLLDRGLDFLAENGDVCRILVPAGGGPHARLGLRLAHDLALGNGRAEVTVLRVVLPGNDVDLDVEQNGVERLIYDELGEESAGFRAAVIQAPSVVAGALKQAEKGYDLLVIGASEQWFLRNWLFGAIPDRVAEQADCSVLLVKKYEASSVSWLRRRAKQLIARFAESNGTK